MPDSPRSTPPRDVSAEGLGYGVAAYGLWGLFPLFWPLLEPAGALEILACRIVFSLVTVVAILAAGRALRGLGSLSRQTTARLGLAGAIITINWGLYIWGVNSDQVVQTSLGYFINPLVTVAFGVAVLGERIRRPQAVAVAVGFLAVVVLTVQYGGPPYLALALAFSFGVYGLIKSRTSATPLQGLAVECGVTTPLALIVLAVLAVTGSATWIGHAATPSHLALLLAAGPTTAVPLLLFAGAARRLPLTTLGMLQYLAPLMQFLIGVGIRHEPMPAARLAGFALVWVALAILTGDALRHHRRASPSADAVAPAAGEPLVG